MRTGDLEATSTDGDGTFREAAGSISHLLDDGLVLVEFLVACGVGLPVADVAIKIRLRSVQGLTYLIAKVLMQMEPLPKRMTTLLLEAVNMVRYDAPEVCGN